MTQELVDGSFLLADKGLHQQDVVKSVRTYARKLFAEVAVRLVAFGVDLIAVVLLAIFLHDHVLSSFELNETLRTALWSSLLIGYFAIFWASPLCATPVQFLFNMRVLHRSGRRLKRTEALLRSVALVALWGVVFFLLGRIAMPGPWYELVAITLVVYLPTVTARRQAVHDYVARSVVVNRRSIRSAADEQRMQEYLADTQVAGGKMARPSVVKMITDAIVLAIPLFLIITGVQVANQKNMYARVAYAMTATLPMKHLVAEFVAANERWPATEAELGLPLRQNYPDGGYFQLEARGVIRVQFEIRPEFKDGSILLEPQMVDGRLTWGCRTVGDIETRYLPNSCRD